MINKFMTESSERKSLNYKYFLELVFIGEGLDF